jgi:hemerythrin superfamily protein
MCQLSICLRHETVSSISQWLYNKDPCRLHPIRCSPLKAGHKKVKALFAEYKEATPRKQQDIAQTTMQELEIHAGLEEGLIYLAIRKGIDEDDVMNEANEELILCMC